MRNLPAQAKIIYTHKMRDAIQNCKVDFIDHKNLFNKKINALNFIEATANIQTGNKEAFKKLIVPDNGEYISTYHKLLSGVSCNFTLSYLVHSSYNLLKRSLRLFEFKN